MENTHISINALNHLLASYVVTAQNARFCHWNVVGPMFEDNHEMFGELYDYLAEKADDLAERVRALQEYPMSGLANYLAETPIKEYSGEMTAADMQKSMVADLEYISEKMAEFIDATDHDAVTQDIITGEKAEIDKKAWMLRAMLGKK